MILFLFDPENNDFHFLAESPCINAGTPDTTGLNLPEYDLDGNQESMKTLSIWAATNGRELQ